MNRIHIRLLVMLALLSCFCCKLLAQIGTDSGPLPILISPSPAPLPGGVFGGVSLGAYNLRAVKGQPYSLVETTTMVKTLADGTTITTAREERVMRDSEGRERRESGIMKDGKLDVTTVVITDPVENQTIALLLNDKSARVRHIPRPATIPTQLTDKQQAKIVEMRAKVEAYRKEHPQDGTEKLSGELIAGIYAEGLRHTMVIPVGSEGNDRDIHIETETWTSPDLRIIVLSKTMDPRIGKITREVSDLQRIDPDPTLFQIPANYKMIEQK